MDLNFHKLILYFLWHFPILSLSTFDLHVPFPLNLSITSYSGSLFSEIYLLPTVLSPISNLCESIDYILVIIELTVSIYILAKKCHICLGYVAQGDISQEVSIHLGIT